MKRLAILMACMAGLLVGFPAISADLGSCPAKPKSDLFRDHRWLTTNDVMQSWVGAKASDLVASWGAPASTYDNEDGTRILTWKDDWEGCSKSFLTKADGVVLKWQYDGCDCYVDRSKGPPKGTPVPPLTL